MSIVENNPVVTGMGVVSPIGIGLHSYSNALKNGDTNFSSISFEKGTSIFEYPIARIEDFDLGEQLIKINLDTAFIQKVKRHRNISRSTTYGVYSALEAWKDAELEIKDELPKIAIVSSGSNTQQSHILETWDKYAEKLQFLNPNYGLNFFDSDIVGVVSELLGVKGEGYTMGAASASGNLAIIQASRLLKSNEYDIVLVLAPLMDLSVYEYQGFTTLGAMASIDKNIDPNEMYKPFDVAHNGFVYGQSAGCLILESKDHAEKRGKKGYGTIAGYGINLDANRKPNPSKEGEQRAMQAAMTNAGVNSDQITYVNTHGTGSKIGDQTEVAALLSVGLQGVKANSTKSLIGHGLSAAGIVETITSFIQMKEGFLHKSNNLTQAISDEIHWIQGDSELAHVTATMNNSFGFGGVNTSLILTNNV